MRPLRSRRAAALVLAPMLLVSGCSGFSSSGAQPASGRLTIALQFTPKAGYALETDDAFVLTQIGCLETLVKYDSVSGKLEPMLATAWKQSTPTTWDFTLRSNVSFQDGTPMTADGVTYALNHLLHTKVPPSSFNPSVVSSISAVNATTVRVTTPTASPLVPFRLASVNTGIMDKAAYNGNGIDIRGHCTGPFTVVSQVPQQSASLKANDHYWGGSVGLKSVEVKFFPDGNTRATQVQTGESNIAIGIPATGLTQLRADSSVKVTQIATPRTTSLYMNLTKAPFTNQKVRKAIQLAINLDAIAKSVYAGTAEPAFGPFASNEPWAPKGVQPVTANIEQAKALLVSAGYHPGQISVTLRGYTERPEMADLAAVIQAQLKQIGITVKIIMTDYSGMEPSLLNHTYDMALLSRGHLTDIADPIGFFEDDYTCKGSYNITGYCNPAVDKEIGQANSENNTQVRYQTYAQLAKQLQNQAITISLVNEDVLDAHRTDVQNFADDPLERYALTSKITVSH